jgi:2'-hydroxyisoflavone reductase
VAAGLRFRSVGETATGLLAWWAQQERRNQPPRAGLKPEREAELLRLLEQQGA